MLVLKWLEVVSGVWRRQQSYEIASHAVMEREIPRAGSLRGLNLALRSELVVGTCAAPGILRWFCIAVNDLTWVCVKSNPREGESRDDFCEGSACSLPQEV